MAVSNLKPQERIIVALDVPSSREALKVVDKLEGLVTFYKVGLELLMSGGAAELVQHLVKDGKRAFVDLKLPGDIPETVKKTVGLAAELGVTFMTLSNSVTATTIRDAVAGRGARKDTKLLYVSFLSSQDRTDFASQTGAAASEFEKDLERRTSIAKEAGADGFIVSGQEIRLLRTRFPDAVLVSPGIRPTGSSTDDHKRSCTPAEAVRLGADYIVIGRPIRNAPDSRVAAQQIIDELTQDGQAR